LAAIVLGWAVPAQAADPLKPLPRPTKEPKYKSEPRYALAVFGVKGETRVWMVLDGAVLYVDRNGNGDLTEAGERLEPINPTDGSNRFGNPGLHTHFNVYDFDLSEVGGKGSSRFRLWHWVRDEKFEPKTDFDKERYKEWQEHGWENGTLWRKVGEKASAQNPVLFARRPEEAQVCHFDGPLTFGLKMGEQQHFTRGEAGADLSLYIGTPGRPVPKSPMQVFSPLLCDEVPAGVHPIVDIEFPGREAGDKPIRVRVPLKQRC
jgi:hypothetical protein